MVWVGLLREIGARSSLLWGVAIASVTLLYVDMRLVDLGFPRGWRWVLPVTAVVSWSIVLSGLVGTEWPKLVRAVERRRRAKKRRTYALKNLETTGGFNRAVLMHYKRHNQQRFQARRDAQNFHEMVRHGLLDYDTLDPNAYMLHYRVPDVVWKWLDAPPAGWDQGRVLTEFNWE